MTFLHHHFRQILKKAYTLVKCVVLDRALEKLGDKISAKLSDTSKTAQDETIFDVPF